MPQVVRYETYRCHLLDTRCGSRLLIPLQDLTEYTVVLPVRLRRREEMTVKERLLCLE